MIDPVFALAFGVFIGSMLGIAAVRGDDWSRRSLPRRRGHVYENTAPDSSEQRPRRFRRSEPDPPEQFIPFDEGRIQRGHGHGGPTTPKPEITPKPQPPGGRLIRDDWGPPSRPPATGGYHPVPRLHGETRNPPPDSPDSP